MTEAYFNPEQKASITAAIKSAEKNTSGEIVVHIENACKKDVLDRAADIFEKLELHKTKLRNGVLIYLAMKDHKFAILGDGGINAKVPDNFWDEIRNHMLEHFKENRFTEGLDEGIRMAGEQLSQHFPYQSDDKNELSDDISFGS